ncbi:MAG: esterase/lipase family protein [Planctomycetota bacterium]
MSTNSAADLKALRASTLLGAVGLLMLSATGCAKPLLSLDASTPPLILVPLPHAGVVDGRGRFREIYGAIREDHGRELPDDRPVAEALHQLANEPAATGVPVHLGPARTPLRFAFVPGLFGECVQDSVGLFSYAREHVEEHGYRTDIIVVSGRSSSEHNAGQIREAVMAAEPAPAERLVLVGYSKGAVDSLTAVTEHPEIRDRVAAVVSICGPIGGAPSRTGSTGSSWICWRTSTSRAVRSVTAARSTACVARPARRGWRSTNCRGRSDTTRWQPSPTAGTPPRSSNRTTTSWR